jgi:NAD(P)H-dependent flavin oxidoreductase YrpB (nitropropane dioxygenase family)
LSLSNLGHPGISDKMGSISTRMTERFGCRHPFAGAGMAFAGSTADLALGVCAGGGIGAIGVGVHTSRTAPGRHSPDPRGHRRTVQYQFHHLF